MLQSGLHDDECVILIKAQPHRSTKYFETVCCAGVGRDQKWRRQYPVPFRILNDSQKFARWSWISYQYSKSNSDPRAESQKVAPESLQVGGELKRNERAQFLAPLVRASFSEADSKRESLTLIRPTKLEINATLKSKSELESETAKHKALADQLSFFDATAKPLKPCPVSFSAHWTDQDGKMRRHECDDWESYAAYNKFEAMYGSQEAIKNIKQKFEVEYFAAGLVLAFSTHKRRNLEFSNKNQWLLVGIIRLDESRQSTLDF